MTSPQGPENDLRREIEEVDAAIHDLLMRRTELAAATGAALRPGSEAQSLRRLIGRHRGPFPKRILVRIWREILSALAALESPMAVAAYAPEQGVDLRGLARDHFGSESPLASCETTTSVLRQVTEGQAKVGVVPLPRDGEADPWWRHLARGGAVVPRIVARLPFAALEPARAADADGLVIALDAPAEASGGSGADHSFIVVETGEHLSRSRLTRLLTEAGLSAVNIQVWSDHSDHRLHLIEVEGHVPGGDRRLTALLEAGDPDVSHLWSVGGYPIPLSPGELAAPALAEA